MKSLLIITSIFTCLNVSAKPINEDSLRRILTSVRIAQKEKSEVTHVSEKNYREVASFDWFNKKIDPICGEKRYKNYIDDVSTIPIDSHFLDSRNIPREYQKKITSNVDYRSGIDLGVFQVLSKQEIDEEQIGLTTLFKYKVLQVVSNEFALRENVDVNMVACNVLSSRDNFISEGSHQDIGNPTRTIWVSIKDGFNMNVSCGIVKEKSAEQLKTDLCDLIKQCALQKTDQREIEAIEEYRKEKGCGEM